jgi:1-acyl-sn-glycerol-3-phosphate acyltransferase
VFGLKVERFRRVTSSYGNAIYIANHQNNYDMVTASNIVQPPTVTVGKKACCGSRFWPAVLADG